MQKLKIVSIIVFVALVAFGFWFTAKPWVDSPVKFADWHIWILPAIMLVITGTVTSLAYMLLPRKRLKLLVAALIGGTFLIVYGVWYFDVIAFFLILLLHTVAIRHIHQETEERLRIHVGQIIRRGIAMLMIPFYMALSFAFYSTPTIQTQAKNPDLAPNLRQVVREVMDKFLERELNSVPAQIRYEATNSAIDRAYSFVTSFFAPYEEYFPPILAFGIFLILVSIGFILHWLCIWLGMIIFWILRKTKFVYIEQRQVQAESLTLWQQTTTKL